MPYDILIPSFGVDSAPLALTRWLKATHDPVERWEPLADITGPGVEFRLVAPASGVLGTLEAEPGTPVAVGQRVASVTTID